MRGKHANALGYHSVLYYCICPLTLALVFFFETPLKKFLMRLKKKRNKIAQQYTSNLTHTKLTENPRSFEIVERRSDNQSWAVGTRYLKRAGQWAPAAIWQRK